MELVPDFRPRTPSGDDRARLVCGHCGFVDYVNPRVVVGSVVTWTEPDARPGAEPLILLCRRAIEPRRGFWTLPAGYLEAGEGVRVGAAREAREEAGCEIAIDALLAIYDVPHISQVQMMFRASLAAPVYAAGVESLEVALFAWDEIPWHELAFETVFWALHHWRETRAFAAFVPFGNPNGAAPSPVAEEQRRG